MNAEEERVRNAIRRDRIMKRASELRDGLRIAFVWSDSRRGSEYWVDVCEELDRIAETGEP